METRANYMLIGVFTLLAILGTLGFFIWLASVQINRQYGTYGILFDDVSGLDASGDVLFNGIVVGKVIGLRIFEDDPSKVFTTVEIDTTTPVRTDTVAQLQSQGVTGVAYIALVGGTPGAAPLMSGDDGLPIIPSRRSTVQALVEDAPDLLTEATRLLEQFQVLTGPENQAHITNILRNIDASSARLDQALTDFSDITGTVGDATAQITLFTNRLDTIGAAVETTLTRADTALASAQQAFDAAEAALTTSGDAIDSVEGTFTQAETILRDDIPAILTQVSEVVAATNTAISELRSETGAALDGYAGTADLLNARLAELEVTLLDANTAFAAVTEASDSFDTLVDGDGTLLVVEARAVLARTGSAITTIETILSDDVPAVVADIRAGVATATAAIDQVAADLTGLTGQLDPLANGAEQALSSANVLFARARTTLDGLDTSLTGATDALASAQMAFDTASRLMNTDIGPVLADIGTASARIGTAVEEVTRDVPAITTDLRALIARADAVMAQLQQGVAASAPDIGDFADTGLREITRLAQEARTLVSTLETLVRRIEQNPTRFLLDDRVPTYER